MTVHLYSEYRILEHGRLSRLAGPVLDTDSKQIKSNKNLKKKFQTKNPTITGGKVQRKLLPPPKLNGGTHEQTGHGKVKLLLA